MLHIALRNKIPHAAVRLLYDSGLLVDEPTIKPAFIAAIRKFRQPPYNTKAKINQVEARLATYGNNGGWYVAKVKEYVKSLYQAKNVSNDFLGQWRTIEFELIFENKKDCEDFGYLVYRNGMKQNVHIKEDGSLRTDSNKPEQLTKEVTLTYKAGDEGLVREFCKMLKGRAHVNKTCGTHVHFDFRHVGGEEATLYGKRLERCVPALRFLLPASRRNSEYCKEDINNYMGGGDGGRGRYAFVNMLAYNKYKTIEVRGHSGTINADKILNWIKLCEVIMATDLNFTGKPEHRTKVKSVNDLLAQYADKFDAGMVEYIKNRTEAFAVPTAEEGEAVLQPREVVSLAMFEPQPKKPAPPKAKTKRKKKAAGANQELANAVIPAAINAQPAP